VSGEMEIMTIASNVAPGMVALGECMDIFGGWS
jgi:hypothetical protein